MFEKLINLHTVFVVLNSNDLLLGLTIIANQKEPTKRTLWKICTSLPGFGL